MTTTGGCDSGETVLTRMGQISGAVGLQQWTEGPLADLLGAGLPWKALAGGRTSGIELLVGHTRDEFRLFSVMMGRLGTFTPAPLQRPADTGDLGGLLGIAAGMGPLRHGRRSWMAHRPERQLTRVLDIESKTLPYPEEEASRQIREGHDRTPFDLA
ncbi:hypothetical protein [Streptomyces sp. NPDC087298]|uniref:hypothetical protein n=1 Tax=Streptomyces sp. NPDC087298 TaxID=3365779 RepID=UPI00381AD378